MIQALPPASAQRYWVSIIYECVCVVWGGAGWGGREWEREKESEGKREKGREGDARIIYADVSIRKAYVEEVFSC